MKDVVWVEADGNEQRVSVRELIAQLAEMGVPGDLVSFVMPASIDDRGYDTDIISDHWGLLGQDLIHVDVSHSAVADLVQKIRKIVDELEFEPGQQGAKLAIDSNNGSVVLIKHRIQLRLLDAAILG
jgi:hypothetical protein